MDLLKHGRIEALLAGLAVGVFLADIYTPLGYVSSTPYLVVIVLASLSDSPRLTRALAVLCSGLLALGIWIYPVSVAPLSVVLVNRLILLAVLWITSGLARRNQRMRRRLRRQQRALKTANAKLAELAWQDGLTGLANRRSFDQRLATECNRAAREQGALSLLMIDIDRFKRYNDSLGHQAGDDCLIRVAGVIHAEFRRAGDFAARYGGEEFAVILPETSQSGAVARAEALRRALAASGLPHPDNDGESCVTVSIGVAAGEGRPNSPKPTALIQAADSGLYLAKQQGRNRVCVAHERPYGAQSL